MPRLPLPPYIIVTSPKSGDSWAPGSTHPITWKSYGDVGSNVKIELWGGGIQTLAASTLNDGTFSWTIPSGQVTGTTYMISVSSTTDPSIWDWSDYFSITSTPSTPSITVTSPNGGESWQRGTSHTVTWSYAGNPGSTVKIALMKGGIEVGTIASSVPTGSSGTGSYTWAISSDRDNRQ